MLRTVFLLLLLANGAYYAWSQGALEGLGLAPASPSEPLRVANQLKPGSVRLQLAEPPAVPASRPAAEAPPAAPTVACLQAGPIEDEQLAAVRAALAALPAGAGKIEPLVEAERWMVYMGKFADDSALARKKAELKRRNVNFDPLTVPSLQPGLSLGRFSNEANANAALKQLEARGVTTAKVVIERTEGRGQYLRLPAVDDALRSKLDGLKAVLSGKPLQNCG
ncbi:MAG: SPOR domain-containing protein [Pseudomonadota bacterium]